MARELTFRLKRKKYTVSPIKVERKKLYGWTEILALDDNGDRCNLLSTDESGALIIPKGGTGLGILNPNGEWVDRSSLKTITQDGTPAELIPSTYQAIVNLKEKITPEDFLNYSITDFYLLGKVEQELVSAIGTDIYRFPYTYLDSYETIPAFLLVSGLSGKDTSLFMLLGMENNFEMLCFGDCGEPDNEAGELMELTDDDDIDFSMFQF